MFAGAAQLPPGILAGPMQGVMMQQQVMMQPICQTTVAGIEVCRLNILQVPSRKLSNRSLRSVPRGRRRLNTVSIAATRSSVTLP